ncbi:hypothetical protein METBIDRAFT_26574, partial [Metschnikowia bicuspidata var. bicuspidata NRRL YB-4993]
PPSYEEALNSPPVPPGRPQADPQENPYSSAPPPQPPRPQAPVFPNRPQQPQGPGHTQNPQSALLYTNNPNLPFDYPRGYYCNKCKNTGFREKNMKPCSHCWSKFFKDKAYNPNPSLNFKYPRGYICDKCRNTGTKVKNGRSCQDCYSRFAPRNLSSQAPITYSLPAFGFAPGGFAPPNVPQYVQPGDPRMGGTMCGRCRGSGRTTFFLDKEICLVCGGVGRLF